MRNVCSSTEQLVHKRGIVLDFETNLSLLDFQRCDKKSVYCLCKVDSRRSTVSVGQSEWLIQ